MNASERAGLLPCTGTDAEAPEHNGIIGGAGVDDVRRVKGSLLNVATQATQRHGWSPDRLRIERFGRDEPLDNEGDAFEARLASSHRIIRVAADQSVVQALRAAGRTARAMRAGRLWILPCCSRALSPTLVLDL